MGYRGFSKVNATTVKALRDRIFAARRQIPADLVLKEARVVNVFSGGIQERDVAVFDGIIVGVGSDYHGKNEVHLKGKYVVPGLIDGHFHIESSMLLPSNLAAALLIHGTTTIVTDPHEIANVMGMDGIRFMLEESRLVPFDIFFMAPSCVPATPLETSGSALEASEISVLRDEPRVLGLAEMMNFPGVLAGEQGVLEKILLFKDQVIDGHCPLVRGYDLQAYMAAGIRSDHESTQREEGLEKLENGMMLMIREGTSAKNLEELLPLINKNNARRACFVSDDLHAEDIQERGHLDFIVKKAIQQGLDPATAVQLVTLNPADYFGLKERGAVAPGYCADLVVLDDLEAFEVASVYKNGHMVVDRGDLLNFPTKGNGVLPVHSKPLNISPFTPERFRIPYGRGKARVIEVIPSQLVTRMCEEEVQSDNGWVFSDIEADILKLSVVERHEASGRIGLGLVKGFGLRHGALASSVAHDSHNVIVVGVSDEEIVKAVEVVKDMGGGLVVVRGNEILARTPLEIAGLMSTRPLSPLISQLRAVKSAAHSIGCALEEPFMSLSFLALPVIPELKLTDRGLVDVNNSKIVPLFLGRR
jgi:adenine deaminase